LLLITWGFDVGTGLIGTDFEKHVADTQRHAIVVCENNVNPGCAHSPPLPSFTSSSTPDIIAERCARPPTGLTV